MEILTWILVYVFAATRNLPCNTAKFMDIAQILCFLPFLLWSYTVCEYLISARNLTIGEFGATHGPMIKRAFACAFFEGLSANIVLVNMLVRNNLRTVDSVGIFMLYAFSALLSVLVGMCEKRQKYIRLENKEQRPEQSILIHDTTPVSR